MLDERILSRIHKKLDMIPEIEKQGALNKLALKNLNGELQEHKKFHLRSKVNTVIMVSVIIAAISCFIAYKGLVTKFNQPMAVVKELYHDKGLDIKILNARGHK